MQIDQVLDMPGLREPQGGVQTDLPAQPGKSSSLRRGAEDRGTSPPPDSPIRDVPGVRSCRSPVRQPRQLATSRSRPDVPDVEQNRRPLGARPPAPHGRSVARSVRSSRLGFDPLQVRREAFKKQTIRLGDVNRFMITIASLPVERHHRTVGDDSPEPASSGLERQGRAPAALEEAVVKGPELADDLRSDQ